MYARVAVVAFAVLALPLAGCLGDGGGAKSPITGLDVARLSMHGETTDGSPILHQGAHLSGPPADFFNSPPPFLEPSPTPPCEEGVNCERIPFTVHDAAGQTLAVSLEWEAQDEDYDRSSIGGYLGGAALAIDFWIVKDGQVVADGVESFHYAGVALIPNPEPGDYVVEAVARYGSGSYLATIRLQEPDLAAGLDPDAPLLPDLIMLPPDHLNFNFPLGTQMDALGSPNFAGCGPDEAAEDQDRRCLRFAGILGNQGLGIFETILQYEEAANSVAAPNGHWEQKLYHPNGGSTTFQAGAADYHAIHGHFHILDLVATQLYTYDEETGERGEPVGEGRKMGFCIIDGGLIDPRAPASQPRYEGGGCCYLAGTCQLDMLSHEHFVMGMSPGWYDTYPWWRSDQYVEVTGIPDGTYELVSIVNPAGILVEANLDNNESGTIFRLTGNDIEVLGWHTQAEVGPHPDANWDQPAP